MGHTVWWAGSYEVTPPPESVGVGSTGHYEENAGERVSRFMGSDPTLISSYGG